MICDTLGGSRDSVVCWVGSSRLVGDKRPLMYVTYMLECGHISSGRQYPNQMVYCLECDPKGDTRVRLFAIETREWKLTCQDCRHAKWCGQDENGAKTYAYRHMTTKGHVRWTVDYLQHPQKVREVQQIYGRRFPRRFGGDLPKRPMRIRDLPELPPF